MTKIAAIHNTGPTHTPHGGNEAATSMTLPPPRKQRSAQQSAPGYVWNGMTQELIPILPEDHPDYRENAETIRAAFRRWKEDIKMSDQLKQLPARLPKAWFVMMGATQVLYGLLAAMNRTGTRDRGLRCSILTVA